MTFAFNFEEGKCTNCDSYYMYSGKEEFFLCIICGKVIYLEAKE